MGCLKKGKAHEKKAQELSVGYECDVLVVACNESLSLFLSIAEVLLNETNLLFVCFLHIKTQISSQIEGVEKVCQFNRVS